MKRIIVVVILVYLLTVLPLLAADYEVYVSTTAAGAEDCSTSSDPCLQADIPWSTIETQRQSANDSYVYFKGGETFTREVINDGNTSTATALLYIGDKDGFGTGRPVMRIRSWEWHGLMWAGISNLWINGWHIYQDVPVTQSATAIMPHPEDGGGNQQGPVKITDITILNLAHYGIVLDRVGDTLAEQTIVEDIVCTNSGNCVYSFGEGVVPPDYGYINNITCYQMNWADEYDYVSPAYDGHCVGLQGGDYWIVENSTSFQAKGAFVNWVNPTRDSNFQAWRNLVADQTEALSHHFTHGDTDVGDPDSAYQWAYHNVSIDSGMGSHDIGDRPAFRICGFTGTGGVWYLHNTSYNDTVWGVGNRRVVDNSHWINNIIVTSDNDENLFYIEYSALSGTNHEVKGNWWWTLGGDPEEIALWQDPDGSGAKTFAQWQALGYDDNKGGVADPLFNAPGSDDFTLTATSPPKDAGEWLATVTQATNSGYTFTVDEDGPFHGDWGLKNKDGGDVTGSPVTLWDSTNGFQYSEVDSVNRSTGALTLNDSVSWRVDETVVGLGTVYGPYPDAGAKEYGSGGDVSSGTGLIGISHAGTGGVNINFSGTGKMTR